MASTRRLWALLFLALPACGGGGAGSEGAGGSGGSGAPPVLVTVSGHAMIFGAGRLPGAQVSIVEQPERTTTTADDGAFSFDGLDSTAEVTFELAHPDYVPIQTGTIVPGEQGAERVTFQAVDLTMYSLLSGVVRIEPDPARCQIASTVTRVGKSMYDEGAHGEEGATVTIDPALPAESGPIYFNESVIPQLDLTETSPDGGVLFVQVPPGDYLLTAHKEGAQFTQVKIRCRAGILANASPPWGLQRL